MDAIFQGTAKLSICLGRQRRYLQCVSFLRNFEKVTGLVVNFDSIVVPGDFSVYRIARNNYTPELLLFIVSYNFGDNRS